MRHFEITDEPNSYDRKVSNLVGDTDHAKDLILQIAEIMMFLGFAENKLDFANRFLNAGDCNLDWYRGKRILRLSRNTLDHFQEKLNIGSQTTAAELLDAVTRLEWLIASSRNDLAQLAQEHFNELRQKLASSNF